MVIEKRQAIIVSSAVLMGLVAFSCSSEPHVIEPVFNKTAFPGLVSMADAPPYDVVLDYELGAASGETIRINNCKEVMDLKDSDIDPAEYALYKMLFVNCKARGLFAAGRPATKTFLPPGVNMEFIAQLPADAVPRVSDEELGRRVGERLSKYEQSLELVAMQENSIEVQTTTDILIYNVMARADFDKDGIEDMLLRVDFHSKDAFGKGSDLLMITKTSKGAPISIVWRL